MKKPISFFLVEHEAGDIFGFLLAWCCYAPSFIIAIQTSILLTLLLQSRTTVSGRSGKPNRAVKVAGLVLLGQLLNEALNLVLKNIIKQDRPNSNSSIHSFDCFEFFKVTMDLRIMECLPVILSSWPSWQLHSLSSPKKLLRPLIFPVRI